jgi:hypothetical protein
MKRSPLKRKSSRRKKSETTVLKEKLWELCKQITRRLHGNVCFSCGQTDLEGSNWHTGHFIQSSRCSTELRYDIRNLRPQCFNCNINLGGNSYEYGKALIKAYGKKYVKDLEELNAMTKGQSYGKDWIIAKIDEYQKILETI